MSSHHYIADPSSFQTLCRQLRSHPRFALDTEFVGEQSFVPRLELIQVAAGDLCAVVDFPAIGSLDGFAELLSDPGIEKVIHAGRQDLELFNTLAGTVPASIFDTQVAAAMVGYGTQVAYAQLVQRILDVKLDKSHTLSNWSQRPLTDEQIAYALEDVRYLLPVHDHLQHRLRTLGREEWVREEFARLESRVSERPQDPRSRYQRIRGWDGLKPRSVSVLRELASWRDDEAQRRNVPRGRVVRDEVLLELSRRTPATLAALRGTRGLHQSEGERHGEVLLGLIKKGLAAPQSEWPEVPKAIRPEPDAAGLVDLLQAVVKTRAREEEIAPSLLASAGDLQALVDAGGARDTLDLPLLRGWRRKLAGDAVLQVLDGRTVVSVDRNGKVRLYPKPSDE